MVLHWFDEIKPSRRCRRRRCPHHHHHHPHHGIIIMESWNPQGR